MLQNKLAQLFKGSFEGLTGYIAQISSDHSYVHKGLALTAIINTGSISAAYNIAFKTPAVSSGRYVHWRPIGVSSSANYVDFDLYEGDSFTGGSAVTPINRNRNASRVTTMQSFVKGATVTPSGTILMSAGIGTSGNPTARSGGGAAADQELLLAPDTDYVLRLVPAGATVCKLELFWYEEEGYIS